MRQIAIDAGLTVVFLLLQTTLAQFLSIAGLAPDIALIWVVYIAIRRGQIAGTTAGFAMGVALDLLSGNDGMLGLAALAMTVGGFLAGYFYNDNKTIQTLGSYRFILILLTVTFVHNLIYFIIFLQGSGTHWWEDVLYYGTPVAVYTALIGLIPMFIFARRVPA